jgi:hypothetical protein
MDSIDIFLIFIGAGLERKIFWPRLGRALALTCKDANDFLAPQLRRWKRIYYKYTRRLGRRHWLRLTGHQLCYRSMHIAAIDAADLIPDDTMQSTYRVFYPEALPLNTLPDTPVYAFINAVLFTTRPIHLLVTFNVHDNTGMSTPLTTTIYHVTEFEQIGNTLPLTKWFCNLNLPFRYNPIILNMPSKELATYITICECNLISEKKYSTRPLEPSDLLGISFVYQQATSESVNNIDLTVQTAEYKWPVGYFDHKVDDNDVSRHLRQHSMIRYVDAE